MSGKRTKFLDPAVLLDAVREVSLLAKRDRVRVALVGGYALQLYGSDRLTGDLDFVADRLLASMPEGSPLSFGGERTEAPNGVPVDLILREDAYKALYEKALVHASRPWREVPVLVVKPEYLAAMKMVAGRTKDEADIEFLVASNTVDTAAAAKVIFRFLGPYAVDEWVQLVEEIRWKVSRGKL